MCSTSAPSVKLLLPEPLRPTTSVRPGPGCRARVVAGPMGAEAGHGDGEAAVEGFGALERRENQEGPGVLVCAGGGEAAEDEVVKGRGHGSQEG